MLPAELSRICGRGHGLSLGHSDAERGQGAVPCVVQGAARGARVTDRRCAWRRRRRSSTWFLPTNSVCCYRICLPLCRCRSQLTPSLEGDAQPGVHLQGGRRCAPGRHRASGLQPRRAHGQVMQLFKDIYTQLGLPVLLFPYRYDLVLGAEFRVVATNPGCGVIECVPNARSMTDISMIPSPR